MDCLPEMLRQPEARLFRIDQVIGHGNHEETEKGRGEKPENKGPGKPRKDRVHRDGKGAEHGRPRCKKNRTKPNGAAFHNGGDQRFAPAQGNVNKIDDDD